MTVHVLTATPVTGGSATFGDAGGSALVEPAGETYDFFGAYTCVRDPSV